MVIIIIIIIVVVVVVIVVVIIIIIIVVVVVARRTGFVQVEVNVQDSPCPSSHVMMVTGSGTV